MSYNPWPMQSLTRVLFTWLTAMMLLLGGCSKSVEGESKKWAANATKVGELGAMYPGFKAAIEARKAAAQKIYEAAEGLDEKAKIEKLSEANRTLMGGFIDDLDDLDEKIKELREKRVEAASKAGDEATQLGAKVAAEDVQKTLDRVDATLKSGAADEASAAAILKKITADLDTAEAAVDKVLAVDKAKKDEAAAAKKAAEASKADADAAAAAKVAPWKCEYCSSENPHDETACKSCGAPRKGADDKDAKAAENK